MKEINFNYIESEFKEESEKRVLFELFVTEMIDKFGYNPETDQVDVSGLFERYVWRP